MELFQLKILPWLKKYFIENLGAQYFILSQNGNPIEALYLR